MRGTLRPTTFASYEMVITKRLIPSLGKLLLTALTPEHVNRLYGELRGRGLSEKTLMNVHIVLRRALKDAVAWGYAPKNMAALANKPQEQGQIRHWCLPGRGAGVGRGAGRRSDCPGLSTGDLDDPQGHLPAGDPHAHG